MKRIVLAMLLAGLLVPASAEASFPGANGKIAFVRSGDIWTMNPDGSGQVNLTNDAATQEAPAWSADGNKIAFDQVSGSTKQIGWMYADGSNRTLIANAVNIGPRHDPAWSPTGTRILFATHDAIYTMNPDGSQITQIAGGNVFPDWSPAGNLITFGSATKFCTDLFVSGSDGTNAVQLTHNGGFDCFAMVEGSSWSPDAQRIAYYNADFFCNGAPSCAGEIGFFTIKPDGTDRQAVPNGTSDPAWSPDGTKFAFDGIQVMNADGTNPTSIASGTNPDWQPIPATRPAADVLATLTDSPDPVAAGDELHYTASAKDLVGPDPATNVTLTLNLPSTVFYVSATPTQGSCSQASNVVTCNFGSLPPGGSASVDVDVEPRPVIANTQISASASASAAETDPVPGNNSATQTTTVTFGGHARPHGASPLRVPLVPSYRQCGSEATLQHGAPLSFPSCGNPQQSSGYLTVGTPDANGQGANSTGFVQYTVLGELPINPNNGNQADVQIDFSLTDVRNRSDLSDYTGELLTTSGLRITDRNNGAGGFTSATVQDTTFRYTVPCSATASTTVGATCSLHTTANALVPGTLMESKRAIWQIGQVQVLDGGADGRAATADNTLFAVEGVFVP